MNILIASGIYLGIEKDPCSKDADNVWKELTDIAVHDQNDIDLVIVAGHFFHLKMYQKDGKCDTSPPLSECGSALMTTKDDVQKVNQVVHLNKKTVPKPIFTTNNYSDKYRIKTELLWLFERTKQNLKCYFTIRCDSYVRPILFTKGNVRTALYGINYTDEEELNCLLQNKTVQFELPPGKEKSWFKILVLYRQLRKREKDNFTLDESLLPSWMDLVIFGGNKPCHYQRKYSFAGDFDFVESGHCVVTDYTDAQETGPKAAGLLKIVQRPGQGLGYG